MNDRRDSQFCYDLIEVFKWVKGFNKGDVVKVLTISSQDRTRNNGFKLEKCNLIKKQAEIGLQIGWWMIRRDSVSRQLVHRQQGVLREDQTTSWMGMRGGCR